MSGFSALKWGGAAAVVAAVAFGTWWATSTWYEKEISQARIEALENGRMIERGEAEKTIGVMNDRYLQLKIEADRAAGERDDARRIVERLRKSENTERVPAASADPCRAPRAELAECRSFLAESVELLQEAREGWRESAADKDAIVDLLRTPAYD